MDKREDYVQQLIRQFHLQPLPEEGGLYAQTYRAPEVLGLGCLPQERYNEAHPAGTAILYLLTPDEDSFSALHRLPTDEIYHFYLGDPVEVLLLHPGGKSERVMLGQDILNGQWVQFVAPRGAWQGSHLAQGGRFALLGTTMAPGYVDEDYTPGVRGELAHQYPQEAALIRRLTRVR